MNLIISHCCYSCSMCHAAGSKKKEKQMTVLVEGRKDKSQPFGLILSKKVHNSHKALGVIKINNNKNTMTRKRIII